MTPRSLYPEESVNRGVIHRTDFLDEVEERRPVHPLPAHRSPAVFVRTPEIDRTNFRRMNVLKPLAMIYKRTRKPDRVDADNRRIRKTSFLKCLTNSLDRGVTAWIAQCRQEVRNM